MLAPALVIFFALMMAFLIRHIKQPCCSVKKQLLKKRLGSYAAMKMDAGEFNKYISSGQCVLLHPQEHEILLGILKKVEAKNGVMATIWSLFFASLVAAIFGTAFTKGSVGLSFASTASVFLVATTPFLIASIWGSRQIDNFLKGEWQGTENAHRRAALLQCELMDDALRKEDLLWVSQVGATILAIVLPFLALIFFWSNIVIGVSR